MRAVQLTEATGYSGVEITRDYDPGAPGDNQVLVAIAAAGVTPLEHTITSGEPLPLPPSLPLVLGNEGAGIIVRSNDSAWPEGTPVAFTGPYGMFRAGSWADGTVVDTAHLARVPEGVPLTTAAAMPVAYLTAYLTLRHAGFESGKSVLATGAGGSVGNATYQLARAMGASSVITTAGSPEKAAVARAAGMEAVIDLSSEDLAPRARELSGGPGVDIVVDAVGGAVAASALGAHVRRRRRGHRLLRRPDRAGPSHRSHLDRCQRAGLQPVLRTAGSDRRGVWGGLLPCPAPGDLPADRPCCTARGRRRSPQVSD